MDQPGSDTSHAFRGVVKPVGDGDPPTDYTLTTKDSPPRVRTFQRPRADRADRLPTLRDAAASGKEVAFLGTKDAPGKLVADASASVHLVRPSDRVSFPRHTCAQTWLANP